MPARARRRDGRRRARRLPETVTDTSTATGARPRPGIRIRLSAALHRRPWLKLLALLALPLAWLIGIYVISLGSMLQNAFWRLDDFTLKIEHVWTLDNFRQVLGIGAYDSTYLTIVERTVVIAALVTITDVVIAFPLAYYLVRIAGPLTRRVLLISVVMTLFAGYIVRVYMWTLILADNGVLNWSLGKIGAGPWHVGYSDTAVYIVFVYIWLPFMVLPVYGSLERVPDSLIEASRDLGGRGWTTFRRVVLPLALPGVVAGSIFTFSLTLGDYIIPSIVGGGTQFIGTVVWDSAINAGNIPFAAAYATVPIVIMAVYIAVAKRLGAFESL